MSNDTPLVLVHGVPETEAVWGPLIAELGRPAVTRLSPPGFGAPIPPGFGCTVSEYRDWLIEQLEAFDEPVDLVGHDWGGGHVVNVAMTRPELLRSWATDAIGLFDPDYVWHPLAQGWQTLGQGEASVAALMGGTPAQRTQTMVGLGIGRPVADELAAGQDQEMGRAILSLYRSAAQPVMAEIGSDLPGAAQRPGLCFVVLDDDTVGSDAMRRRAGARAGAQVEVLDAVGHWWLVEDPVPGAQALNDFWALLPTRGRARCV
jgi:pimeloyl-ACP methyl ester carboxylesterase